MKERSVSQATTVTNLSGFGVNASGRKYKTNTEAALQNNTEYEEINYSVDVNETKIWAENIVNSLKSFFIDKSKYTSVYERMGIDEETAYFMYKDVERYKPIMEGANSKLNLAYFIANGKGGIWNFITDIKDGNAFIELENGTIVAIYDEDFIQITEADGTMYSYSDGLCTNIYYPNGVVAEFLYDANGELYDVNYYTGKEEPISIYGEYNIPNLRKGETFNCYSNEPYGVYQKLFVQYGGSQMAFRYLNEILLQDPIILKMLKETYPEADMEDYECYLSALCEHGCGYTAFINMVFENFEGREDEFEKTFGFPMYQVDDKGKVYFNYEYLILDLFNYIWGNSGYTIEELYGDITIEDYNHDECNGNHKVTGMYPNELAVSGWLKEKYGIDIDCTSYFKKCWFKELKPGTLEWQKMYEEECSWCDYVDPYKIYYTFDVEFAKNFFEEQLKRGILIISLADFDLYYPHSLLEPKHVDVELHAMSVIEVTELGIIVSSWGQRYLIKYEDLTNGTLDVFEYEE